eukprot:scaffold7625_cov277-Pinguiococcus_pyrenoidosus.AAC.4
MILSSRCRFWRRLLDDDWSSSPDTVVVKIGARFCEAQIAASSHKNRTLSHATRLGPVRGFPRQLIHSRTPNPWVISERTRARNQCDVSERCSRKDWPNAQMSSFAATNLRAELSDAPAASSKRDLAACSRSFSSCSAASANDTTRASVTLDKGFWKAFVIRSIDKAAAFGSEILTPSLSRISASWLATNLSKARAPLPSSLRREGLPRTRPTALASVEALPQAPPAPAMPALEKCSTSRTSSTSVSAASNAIRSSDTPIDCKSMPSSHFHDVWTSASSWSALTEVEPRCRTNPKYCKSSSTPRVPYVMNTWSPLVTSAFMASSKELVDGDRAREDAADCRWFMLSIAGARTQTSFALGSPPAAPISFAGASQRQRCERRRHERVENRVLVHATLEGRALRVEHARSANGPNDPLTERELLGNAHGGGAADSRLIAPPSTEGSAGHALERPRPFRRGNDRGPCGAGDKAGVESLPLRALALSGVCQRRISERLDIGPGPPDGHLPPDRTLWRRQQPHIPADAAGVSEAPLVEQLQRQSRLQRSACPPRTERITPRKPRANVSWQVLLPCDQQGRLQRQVDQDVPALNVLRSSHAAHSIKHRMLKLLHLHMPLSAPLLEVLCGSEQVRRRRSCTCRLRRCVEAAPSASMDEGRALLQRRGSSSYCHAPDGGQPRGETHSGGGARRHCGHQRQPRNFCVCLRARVCPRVGRRAELRAARSLEMEPLDGEDDLSLRGRHAWEQVSSHTWQTGLDEDEHGNLQYRQVSALERWRKASKNRDARTVRWVSRMRLRMTIPWEDSLGEFLGRLPWEDSLGGCLGRIPWETSLGGFLARSAKCLPL